MKIATIFSRQIVVFCSTLLFLFCFTQLSGCSYTKQNNSLPSTSVVTTKNSAPKKTTYVIKGKRYYVLNNAKNYHQVGTASWYGKRFQGHRTSSRERYNLHGMTAASPTLPLATYVKVTNLTNGKQVVVKVNDRGPFRHNRILDLSYAAAQKLGFAHQGLAKVDVVAIDSSNIINSHNNNLKHRTFPELAANINKVSQET